MSGMDPTLAPDAYTVVSHPEQDGGAGDGDGVEESRPARIRREDEEYQRWGQPVMQRWLAAGVDHAVHGYRKRGTRRRAAEIGWFLSRPVVSVWLNQYRIAPNEVVSLAYRTTLRDGVAVRGETLVGCAVTYGIRNQHVRTWTVVIPEPYPLMGDPVPARLI